MAPSPSRVRTNKPVFLSIAVAALAALACTKPSPGPSPPADDASAPAQGIQAPDPPVNSIGVEAGAPPPPASRSTAGVDLTLGVLGHHNNARRSGAYVQPGLTRAAIATLHRDAAFDGAFTGNMHAQPLFVPDGRGAGGVFYVVTESNEVIAFDEKTGTTVWKKSFGPPADFVNPSCVFHFTPIGITGTPVVDAESRTLYVDAVQSSGDLGSRATATHLVHALSLDDGSERQGWPVDPSGLTSNGHTFDPTVQHQRGALALARGMLYVPYGSIGDCGDYHGWIVGISVSDPTVRTAYATPGSASGIWAPSGVAADDEGNLFVATGNSHDPVDAWAGGEAVLRFPAGVALPPSPTDFFAPSNWHDLDDNDEDLGASGVVLLDMPSSTPSKLALALGKDGFAYLLDRTHLGGLENGGTEGVSRVHVATHDIATAPAVYTTRRGTFVALDAQAGGEGTGCPDGQAGDLIVLRVVDGAPPTLETAWCVQNQGHGSPMVTTTDGTSESIVWVTSDESKQLHAYDGDTGSLLFDGADETQQISGAERFNTLIAVHGRIIVAANSGLYAFQP